MPIRGVVSGGEVISLVGRWDECIFPMLYHTRNQIYCEGLLGRVEVSKHNITATSTHESNCVIVNS